MEACSENPITTSTADPVQKPSTSTPSISSPHHPSPTKNTLQEVKLSKNKLRKLRRYEHSLKHRPERRAKERQVRKERGQRKKRPGNNEKLLALEKLQNALQNGCKVVIDCQYQDHMTIKERTRFAQQIRRVYSSNRSTESPLHLYLTSLSRDSDLFATCCKVNDGFTNYLLDISEKSVLTLFDPSEVVYLTPDAPTTISIDKGFEKDKVYVIGGLVDETTTKNLTCKFAQRTQINCVRLPIDEFFEPGDPTGTFKKVLTVNQVVEIILEWHRSQDWVAAISKGLPERTGFRPRTLTALPSSSNEPS